MKRNLLFFFIIALIFVMTVAFSACNITDKDIEMPNKSSKQSVSTHSDASANGENASQSTSKQGNGLSEGGNYQVSANY